MIKKKIKFSYASKELNLPQRLLVRFIERFTGQKKIKDLYDKYQEKKGDPVQFWSDVVELMGLKIVVKSNEKFKIPSSGPLIVIANHPFGLIDGLILCSLVSKFRQDFKIITHEVLRFTEEVEEFILPIDFSEDRESIKSNIETKKTALDHLVINKGVIILFPAGSVAVAPKLNAKPLEGKWHNFLATLVLSSSADVAPIFFEGKNGWLFHLFASKLKSQTLKYSTYLHETKKKLGSDVNIYCGEIKKNNDLKELGERKAIVDYLKQQTMSLNKK
jgi:putative hemolysin